VHSYDYDRRKGVRKISWEDFGILAAELAEHLETFKPQVIVGIARGGLFPATTVACALRCEFFPARLTRRFYDRIVYSIPVWKVPISPHVVGKVVAIVDEITDTGETLSLAVDEVHARGAKRVITASLVSHSWARPAPDVSVMISDSLVIFPWDQQVLIEGRWHPHPEIMAALDVLGETGEID
jgi:hypoxanthine phosphoribosyltransferase